MEPISIYILTFGRLDMKRWFLATRPWSFIMTIISTSLGASLTFEFNPSLFILTLSGLILAHAATNLLNDYFDVRAGVDKTDSPTSRYRPHPYLMGQISTKSLLIVTLLLYLSVIFIAFYIYLIRGSLIIFLLLLGLFMSVFYTFKFFPLKYKALGEPMVFIVWGPIMVFGSYYVLSGDTNAKAILVSLPIGILVSLVLMANNIRDIDYDSSSGIKTIPIILGKDKSLKLFEFLLSLSYFIVVIIALTISLFSLLAFITLPQAFKIVRIFREKLPDTADPMVAQLTLSFGLLLIFGIILGKLIA
ncbi:1,4-dihydroxy-2-naphthoate octaprenyltransferase [archaeon HR06]|nr:1,4-dihydroxy-2-naphthoate octaprenyltransferase [archaeon HR06]